MRDTCDCSIVLERFGRHDHRAAIEREVGDLRPHLRVDAVVGGHYPHRVDEQIGIPDRPTRSRRPGHRMTAHELGAQTSPFDGGLHLALDADDIGDRVVRRVRGDGLQRGVDGRHGHGDHDDGTALVRPAQCGNQVGVGVETVGSGRVGGLAGAVVPPRLTAGSDGRSKERTADQSEAENADWWGGIDRRHEFRLAHRCSDFTHWHQADYRCAMGAQRAGNKSASSNQSEELEGFGVAVVREEGRWTVKALTPDALTSLSAAETQLRELRSSGAVFGLLDVDDEFFIVLRPAPSGTQLLISDATAAIDYDIAADVLDALHIEIPDIDPDDLDDVEPWEEGDLSVLADLGLPEPVLAVIAAETDLYPDEQLGMIAQRLGFASEFGAALDKLPR